MLRNLVFSLSFAFLAACASTSGRYDPPPIDASPSFGVADPALVPEPPQENAWWTRFEDPSLTHLVEAALRANLDVREAAARVEAARTIHSEARQASLPTGAVTAGNTHQSVARHRTATASAGI